MENQATGTVRFPNDRTRLTTRDAWQYYRANYPHKGIDKNLFISLNYRYNKWVTEQLAKGKRVMLPRRYGSIVFVKERRSLIGKNGKIKLPIDWKATNDYNREHPDTEWKYIYHVPDPNGYLLRMVWIQRGSMFYRKRFFRLQMAKRLRREVVSSFIHEGDFDNIELYEIRKPRRDSPEAAP